MKFPTALQSSLVLALAAAFAAMAMAPPVTAGKHDHVEARALLRAGKILPLSKILDTVRKRVPGDVIEVDLDHEDRGWEYDVKVLTPQGRVMKVTVNARTGVVIGIKDD